MWRTSSSPAFVAARSSGCIVPVSLTGREWRPLPRSCVPPADTGAPAEKYENISLSLYLFRYRRGIISSWQVLFVTAKEASRWLALLVYFCVTRTCARTIYKHLLTDARDGRPFSFNLFWPADFLMASKPQPSLMLLADGLVSALSVTLKRLVRARRIRLPLLFPPPVQIPEATQEFAMQLFCASTLRLGEVLLILRRRTGTAAAVRGLFDWMVNVYAILYLLQELLLSAQRCARDSTQVLAFKTC